jgi:gliding motility-associated-like protein
LNLNDVPVFGQQPVDVTVCQPTNVSFSVTATGYNGCTTNFPFHPSNFANTNSPCPTDIPLFEKKRGKMQNTAMQKHQEGNLSYTRYNLTYQWQLSTDGGNTYTNLSNGTPYTGAQTSTLSVVNAGKTFANYFYQCVVTACNQPVNSAAAEILLCPNPLNLFIPNVFTPNGDGDNDYFQIYYNGTDLIYLDLRIFNRWGEKVFQTNNITTGWDGTYKSVKQEPGVYTYEVTLLFSSQQDAIHKKGTVTLLG